jgi:hypothetical protein
MMPIKTDSSLKGPLIEMLKDRYPDLLTSLGLKLTSSSYHPASFGNSSVVLDGVDLRVRLIVERSQVWMDLASPQEPDNWWHGPRVYEAIHGRSKDDAFTLESCVKDLELNFTEYALAMGVDFLTTRSKLEDQERTSRINWV